MTMRKINFKKTVLFFVLIIFFTPDGMTTLRNSNYIQNAVFLNHIIILNVIVYMYRIRNLIGIVVCILYILKKLYNLQRKIYFDVTITDLFLCHALWVIIVTFVNSNNIYNVSIHMFYCTGYLIILEKCIKANSKKCIEIFLLIVTILLYINLILLLLYPSGITTGKDYLSTPYYFLGTKNQITPLLILSSMIYFLNYKKKYNHAILFLNQTIVVLNTLLMKSGTSILCVLSMLIYNLLLDNHKEIYFVILGKKYKINSSYTVTGVFLLTIGIVFFNLQKIFRWLIVDLLHKDLSISGRTATWALAIKQFLKKPIIGYGYGHMITGHYYAHNAILELLATTGIIGIILYAFFLRKVLRGYFVKKNDIYSQILMSAIISLIIANIGEAFVYNISQLTILIFASNVLIPIHSSSLNKKGKS